MGYFLRFTPGRTGVHSNPDQALRDEYLRDAQKIIGDPNVLINVVSRRVKQLKYGMKPMVESLERLEAEDIALREIIEGKLDFDLYEPEEEEEQTV
jgi:DNA-directed RNA polymerase subunit omega